LGNDWDGGVCIGRSGIIDAGPKKKIKRVIGVDQIKIVNAAHCSGLASGVALSVYRVVENMWATIIYNVLVFRVCSNIYFVTVVLLAWGLHVLPFVIGPLTTAGPGHNSVAA
jgi:hypothetical protein